MMGLGPGDFNYVCWLRRI